MVTYFRTVNLSNIAGIPLVVIVCVSITFPALSTPTIPTCSHLSLLDLLASTNSRISLVNPSTLDIPSQTNSTVLIPLQSL